VRYREIGVPQFGGFRRCSIFCGKCYSTRDTLGCVCRGHFPQKNPVINGSFTERQLELKTFSVESVIARITLLAVFAEVNFLKKNL